MVQYIDKSAIVAEIDRRIKEHHSGYLVCLKDILSLLDTLEVKEVNLDEELDEWQQKHFEGIGYILDGSGGWIGRTSLLNIAEHFFELGIRTQKGE